MKTQKLAATAAAALALQGCYAVPIAPDGTPVYPYPYAYTGPAATIPGTPPPTGTPFPAVLNARLYPENDIATQTGVLSGTVTNLMTGKGRFQLNFSGQTLTGEATRVSGDERKGVASAYGAGGAFMSCEYQMHTPYQGAGTCTFSNGAKYRVHIGS